MAEELELRPGKWLIENGQLKRFKDGEAYSAINPDGEIVAIEQPDNFGYYYEIWENYHFFGLPHGSGWVNELPWVIDFLKMFDKIFNENESYRIETRKK